MSGTQIWRPWRAVAATIAAAGVGGLMLLSSTGSAAAGLVPAPAPTLIPGNVTTCAGAGLSGTLLFGAGDAAYPAPPQASGTGSVTGGTTLNVTVNAGFTLSGIVVKGGPNTNVYRGPFVGPIVIEGMVSPTNPGGQTPAISHWFVCGATTPPTTAPPTTAPPTTAPPTTVVPSGGAETGGGGSQNGVALAGVAALAVGAGAGIMLLRLRRRHDIA